VARLKASTFGAVGSFISKQPFSSGRSSSPPRFIIVYWRD